MITIQIEGKIELGYSGNWFTVKLVQPDGYKIDLNARFKEAADSYPDMSVQVSYYLSTEPVTKNQMTEAVLKKISGAIESELEANSYSYSSWTSGTDYDVTLKVGNHNLYNELCSQVGKYLIIEIKFK